MTINWDQAPAWAHYFIIQNDGRGVWTEETPDLLNETWFANPRGNVVVDRNTINLPYDGVLYVRNDTPLRWSAEL